MKRIKVCTWIGIVVTLMAMTFSICLEQNAPIVISCAIILISLFIIVMTLYKKKSQEWIQHYFEKEAKLREIQEKDSKQLRAVQNDVIQFKRELAHSVRMPLAIISGYGDLLKKGNFQTKEEEQIYIDKICRNIHYLNNTFKLVLGDSVENEQEEYKIFDVRAAVEEVVEQTSQYLQKHAIKIEVNSSCENVYMYGNCIEIMRIFYNLIENSDKHMEHGDAIYITVEQVEHEVLIVYRDNGVGLKDSKAKRTVESNYQGSDAEVENMFQGTGTGLYLVDEIIKKHGGSMEIKSVPDKGFAIYITLPVDRMMDKRNL